MLENMLNGLKDSWFIVLLSLLLLVGGTVTAYRKFGLKRVLLGKKYDSRELVYYKMDKIDWKPTLKTWKIILTGGMSLLTLFLIFMLLALSFIYMNDIKTTRNNDEKLCKEFGTIYPTKEQVAFYNAKQNNIIPELNYEFENG